MKTSHRPAVSLIAAGLLLLAATTARAGERYADSSTGRQIALGFGAGATSLVYTPAKACYAAATTLASGLILACTVGSEPDAASRVYRHGISGDWYVHPDVFTGHRTLRFTSGD